MVLMDCWEMSTSLPRARASSSAWVFRIGGQVSHSMTRPALAAASWVGPAVRMYWRTPSRYGRPGMK